MKIGSVNNLNTSYSGNKKAKRYIASALATLTIASPFATKQAHADYSQPPSYITSTDGSMTDLIRAYAVHGSNYEVEIDYDDNIGMYYKYAGKAYNLDGAEIPNPSTRKPVSIPVPTQKPWVAPVPTQKPWASIPTYKPQPTQAPNYTCDYDWLYEVYGDKYALEAHYDDSIGRYYTYAGCTLDLHGNIIPNPLTTKPQSKPPIKAMTDYDRLYSMYGNQYKLETRYDGNYGKHYVYAGLPLDLNGNIIFNYRFKNSDYNWLADTTHTDFQKIFLIYSDTVALEEHFDNNFGTYYVYAGRYYATDGSEIINPWGLRDDGKVYVPQPAVKPETTQRPALTPKPVVTPRPTATPTYDKYSLMTDLQKMYEIYGNDYLIEDYYDPNYGKCYSYAGRFYALDGSEIKLSPAGTKSNGANNKTRDSRIKEGTDLYSYYEIFGNSYKVITHWDPNVGTYYQYGPYAFTKDGKNIYDTSKLNKFDTSIK